MNSTGLVHKGIIKLRS